MEEIKTFEEQAKELGKNESKIVGTFYGKKILLCGSPLAFSDLIDGKLYDLYREIAFEFANGIADPDPDDNSAVVEAVEKVVLGMLHCEEVIYGTLEF